MKYISTARLKSYEEILEISPANCIRAYHWNKLVSASVYPALQTLEVTLKNALNSMILEHHIYYKGNEWWFLDILSNENDMKKTIQEWKNNNFSANDCIAKLNFGFWLNFFKAEYFDTNYNDNALWGKNCLGKLIFQNERQNFSYQRIYTLLERAKKIEIELHTMNPFGNLIYWVLIIKYYTVYMHP